MIYKVPYGGPVLGPEERAAVIRAYDTGQFWDGQFTRDFEREIAQYTNSNHAVFTNSGSSALLLALSALKLKPHSKVLTVALTFPTAVNIIYQTGNYPVFIDVEMDTLNTTAECVKKAIKQFKPKAAIVTHVIGNSPDLRGISEVLAEEGIPGIEDACDCLGGTWEGKSVGTWLDIGCFSFHPAHPLTAGIGGASVTDNDELAEKMRRFRDWGRVPQTYRPNERFWIYKNRILDNRYTYTEMGYNLMCSDLHAAIGLEQLKKLNKFVARRYNLWAQLSTNLAKFKDLLIMPKMHADAQPVWFGYPIIPRQPLDSGIEKTRFMAFLESGGVETRSIYGGPVQNQPAYAKAKYFQSENLANSRFLADNAFWVSCWHGLNDSGFSYLTAQLEMYLQAAQRRKEMG